MISDSCNCCGRSGHGCKGHSRPTQPSCCPICDRNKVRRRCQSEGLYQEGDPLKELNWCCDRGCVLLNRSSKCSQIKKTDVEMNEKKNNYMEDAEMDRGDNYYNYNKKHHSGFRKEKLDNEISNHFHNCNHDINSGVELGKSVKSHKYPDLSPENSKCHMYHHENITALKYHPADEFRELTSSDCKAITFTEKEKNSMEVRERYIKEMEILRSKLNLLKDGMICDGKRLRQRSESEPGFAELPGGVPKRARDNSPKMKMGCRKLPLSPNINQGLHRFPLKQNLPFQKESRIIPPSTTTLFKARLQKPELSKDLLISGGEIKDLSIIESDEDQEGSTCDEEVHSRDDTDVGKSDDDDGSVLSTLTSASSDSNTPSKVGESLGSITLNEIPQKEISHLQSKIGMSESVPTHENILVKYSSLECEELFRRSLFPNVPPYVKFFMHDLKGPSLPVEITKHLKWKLSSITPIVITRTLVNSGFKLVRSSFEQYYNRTYVPPHRNEDIDPPFPRSSRFCRKTPKESNDWTGQWGKHMKSFVFKTLKDFQKLNHFPGTFQIGRKDRLWKNLYRLMVKFGKKEFGFIPKTYILPQDRKLLRTAWEKASGPGKGQWIVKPPAAARGTGIKVIHKWGQIPKKKSLIVQKYIAQPYLINGSKFDLRLYVLMTSIHPLRIYLYDDGLVRFASVKYSDDVECLSNRFMHLTNYSINKLSTQYQVNADATSCHGHKWSLKSLWTYLGKEGVNVKALRKNLTDLVIKTIISGESNINILSKNNLPSRYCSYELFGIDVLLDHSLKPWLLEVNISPSLHSASPLDLAVKGPLVKELLNIAGFQIPAKLTKEQEELYLESYGMKSRSHTLCYDKRLYWTTLSKEEKAKQDHYQNVPRDEYLSTILEDLTPDDVRHLIQFEDELTQLKRFEKIFPTSNTHTYHQFFESPRYYNMVLDAWETKYQRNRAEGIQLLASLCEQKIHLNVPFPGGKTKSCQSLSELSSQAHPEAEVESETDKDKEQEVEETKEEEEKVGKASPPTPPPYPTVPKGLPLFKQRPSSKPAVVSKPTVLLAHPVIRRPKAMLPPTQQALSRSSPGPEDANFVDRHVPLKETCIKMLAEIRQNGLSYASDSKAEKPLKQFPNCGSKS